MPRKMYGTSDTPDFGALLPSAGDPEFDTDAQNNDEYYMTAADGVRNMGNEDAIGGPPERVTP